MTLFHYTCSHSARKIGRYGTLLPSPQLNGRRWVWLTDMEQPDRLALGLTSHTLKCDRMEHRYIVTDTRSIRPFSEIASGAQAVVWTLSEGAQPEHWFVSEVSVPCRKDLSWLQGAGPAYTLLKSQGKR